MSPNFKNGDFIPKQFTCQGENINPELHIAGVPHNAQSLLLIMDDPDAPEGTWVHWTVWNINPKTEKILQNSVPEKSQLGITSFGKCGYGGPCPPSGVHRYFFKLYALDTVLDVPPASRVEDLECAMNGHIITESDLIGLYGKE